MRIYLAFLILLKTVLVSGQSMRFKDSIAVASVKFTAECLNKKNFNNCTFSNTAIRQGQLTFYYCDSVKLQIHDSLKRLSCRFSSPFFIRNLDKKNPSIKVRNATIKINSKVYTTSKWKIFHPFEKRIIEPQNIVSKNFFPQTLADPNFAKNWMQIKKNIKDTLSLVKTNLRSYQCYMFLHPRKTVKFIYHRINKKDFERKRASRRLLPLARKERFTIKKEIRHTKHKIRFTKRQLRKRSFILYFKTA